MTSRKEVTKKTATLILVFMLMLTCFSFMTTAGSAETLEKETIQIELEGDKFPLAYTDGQVGNNSLEEMGVDGYESAILAGSRIP